MQCFETSVTFLGSKSPKGSGEVAVKERRLVLAVCDICYEKGAGAKERSRCSHGHETCSRLPRPVSLTPSRAAASGGCENPLSPGACRVCVWGAGGGVFCQTQRHQHSLGLQRANVGLGLGGGGSMCMEGTLVTAGTVILIPRAALYRTRTVRLSTAGCTVTN